MPSTIDDCWRFELFVPSAKPPQVDLFSDLSAPDMFTPGVWHQLDAKYFNGKLFSAPDAMTDRMTGRDLELLKITLETSSRIINRLNSLHPKDGIRDRNQLPMMLSDVLPYVNKYKDMSDGWRQDMRFHSEIFIRDYCKEYPHLSTQEQFEERVTALMHRLRFLGRSVWFVEEAK